jgi:acyl-CoA thioester hydrolase
MTTDERFEIGIPVTPGDIDDLGHVNNMVYLRWVQDVAIAHWSAATSEQERDEVAWVALRHEIDYRQPARLGDSVIASTWVGLADAHRFERLTEVLRAGDRRVLARARTLWAPINRKTGRLTRVSDSIRERFSRGRAGQV